MIYKGFCLHLVKPKIFAFEDWILWQNIFYTLKTFINISESWNSFRMSGKPQYAVPAADYSGASGSGQPQMTHSSSGYFVPSTVSVPTAVQGSTPRSLSTSSLETSALAPSASSLAKSQADQSSPIVSVGGQAKYIPVTYHWFFCRHRELRQLWEPFSFADSVNLEDAFRSGTR